MSASHPSVPDPVAAERLLEIRRARSFLTMDLVEWRGGKLAVSLGFTPISERNPARMTRYVTIDRHELAAVIAALEKARVFLVGEAEAGGGRS